MSQKTPHTYQELGALLIAVGSVMAERGLCAGAALDGNSDDELIQAITAQDIPVERAKYLITLDLDTVVNYMDIGEF